jgi:hypothetical protein
MGIGTHLVKENGGFSAPVTGSEEFLLDAPAQRQGQGLGGTKRGAAPSVK